MQVHVPAARTRRVPIGSRSDTRVRELQRVRAAASSAHRTRELEVHAFACDSTSSARTDARTGWSPHASVGCNSLRLRFGLDTGFDASPQLAATCPKGLGLLGQKTLRAAERVRAEEAMSLGRSTIRPSARRAAIAQRMRDQELARIVVTHSDGVLVGVLRREDLA